VSTTLRLQLPDFCTPRALLAVLVIVSLTAILLALSSAGFEAQFLSEFAHGLLFLVWVGLAGAALLCRLRGHIATRSVAWGSVMVLGALALLIAVLSEAAYWVLASPELNPENLWGPPPHSQLLFLVRNVLMGLVVTGLALRYFYVAQQWRLNVESHARSRVNALQARIRPHFLYNSMNTIASLTRSNPSMAEEAVQDLADLFRANLNEKRSLITLKEELEAARIYQRIEQLRMGDRLKVRWEVRDLPMLALVPALTVQPLLENAIGHGVENLEGGGTVTVEGTEIDGIIVLRVRNPLPPETAQGRGGHGIALDNIRERVELLFGTGAEMKSGREADEFVVELRFPATLTPPELAS
jgi:two-component system, LytTR family, sensor histidine kinase AlgZ